jgi:hypothetical protein
MTLLRHTWAKGAVAGFVLAVVILIVAFSGLTEQRLDEPPSVLSEIVTTLVATPLFALGPIKQAPEAIQVALLVLWWMGVGALMGWSAGKGSGGRILAGLFFVVLIAGHVQTKITIEREIEGALRALGAAIGEMVK